MATAIGPRARAQAPGARAVRVCAQPVSGPIRPRFTAPERRAGLLDAELVRRCLDGDECAWVAIVKRFSPYVYAIATRFGLRQDRAEDVHQEVFTRVFTRLGSLRDHAALKPWIAQLARRASIDRLRSDARERARLDVEQLPQPQPELAQIEQAMTLWRALDDLPLSYREVVSRFFLKDQSYRKIAEDLGIPAGTVASRISRGLTILRGELETRAIAKRRAAG